MQFAKDPETLNQYFRSMTPNTGPFDVPVIAGAVSALFDKIGPGILVTHSQSGGPGWVTAIKNRNVKAIVAYEPGSGFIFPEGEVPASMPSAMGPLEGVAVPLADFKELTKIPIVIYYGDNIPEQPTARSDRRQLAGAPRHGAAVARCCQPPRRRCRRWCISRRSASVGDPRFFRSPT